MPTKIKDLHTRIGVADRLRMLLDNSPHDEIYTSKELCALLLVNPLALQNIIKRRLDLAKYHLPISRIRHWGHPEAVRKARKFVAKETS